MIVRSGPTANERTHANGASGARVVPSAPPRPARRLGVGLPGLLLILVTLACFLPAVRCDFICLDDHAYVTENSHVLGGLTWANLGWAFRTTEAANWHPLTWWSHLLDVQLFGVQPWGHHLTSVILHALNTGLVLVVLHRLTGAYWRSWMVAALFGLHPLHVESVAWVAERKDVLSTFWGLLAIWAYAHWADRTARPTARAPACYWLALACFAVGLMCKQMLVTLPCLLLVLDAWPGRRFAGALAGGWARLREKLPFFALAAAASVVVYRAQSSIGYLVTLQEYPWTVRVANAVTAYGRYLGKAWWPTRLAVGYPFAPDYPLAATGLAAALLAGISLAAFAWRKRRPYLLVGWLWFLGTLVPVIGLVQVGRQSMADRYTYVPLIGVFIMGVWGVAEAVAGWNRRTRLVVLGPVAGAVLAGCLVLTERQLALWKDSETLFRHALAVTDRNFTAHQGLGYALAHSPGHAAEAIAEYQAALQLEPDQADVHHALGKILAETPGRLAEGINEFRATVRLKPGDGDAHLNLGIALTQIGEIADALAEFETAVRLKPESAVAHYNLAQALAQSPARQTEAAAEYETVLRLRPDWAGVHCNLGLVLAQLPGHLSEAIAEFEMALRAQPGFAEAHNNLGTALRQVPGRTADAIAEYRAAVALRPDFWEARFNLGVVLAGSPATSAEAVVQFEAVLSMKPDFEPARALLARLRTDR